MIRLETWVAGGTCRTWLSVLLTAFSYGAVADENLIRNPGFEEVDADGITVGWNEYRPMLAFEDGAGEDGSRGLVFRNSNPEFYKLVSQSIPIAPGKAYRFSARVKFATGQKERPTACACLEWLDEKGGWIGGGAYVRQEMTNAGQWMTLAGKSQSSPTNAVTAKFSVYGYTRAVGEFAVDNVCVETYDIPEVQVLVSSGYRATYTGEVARLHAHLALGDVKTEDIDVRLTIADSLGRKMPVAPPEKWDAFRAFWRFDTAPLETGTYRATVSVVRRSNGLCIGERSVQVVRVARFPERKVWIDARQRLIVDGLPFFPLGLYWKTIDEPEIGVCAKGPFNCIMPYTPPTAQQLDVCAAKGIRVFYTLKNLFAKGMPSDSGAKWERREMERTIREFRDHRAVLGWYVNDEKYLDPYRPSLEAHQRWVEELDPDHPSWGVILQAPEGYQQTCDVLGIDHYPVPREPISNMIRRTRSVVDAMHGERPVWMVPQAMSWATYSESDPTRIKTCRYPTEQEQRNMAWQCIAGGANGLVFYSWFDMKRLPPPDSFEARWPQLCRVVEEIRRYVPVMLSPEPEPKFTHDGPALFGVRAWKYEEQTYLLAVNPLTEPVSVTIRPHDGSFRLLKTEFGPSPVVDNGKLAVTFPPICQAIWVLAQ